jgi:hypothetical protein
MIAAQGVIPRGICAFNTEDRLTDYHSPIKGIGCKPNKVNGTSGTLQLTTGHSGHLRHV